MKMYFIMGIVCAVIFLVIGIFYLINSIHQYGTWIAPTIVCLAFASLGVFCTMGLIKETHQKPKDTTSIETATTGHINEPNAIEQLNTDKVRTEHEQAVLKALQKSYQKLGTITFIPNTKTYQIQVTDDNTKKAIDYVIANPQQAQKVGYNNLTNNIKQISNSVQKQLGTGYSISLMNPQNTNTPLYTASDGNTTFDQINSKN